ncbi:MAG: NF038105 family protein [Acinetobacter sp.]|nr:NF038105 family protein [Acinetobacter sp.]
MSVKKFDSVATPSEPLTVNDIPAESVQKAWQSYESKPEYKEFNKHDMIDAMLEKKQDESK